MPKITPFLWFDNQAEEAMHFYASIFKNAKIGTTVGDGVSDPAEKVTSVTFELEGQRFIAFNGGPHFTFNPAISFFVNCETQDEIDDLWDKLSAGGEKLQCGWLKDKFGVTWQVVPSILSALLNDDDPERSKNVMTAMLQMKKLDIKRLTEAAESSDFASLTRHQDRSP